jgi:glycosyltransferase involved in cell wall biosynthesis
MNREPLVSVIMIFLNAERFIQEAIESVLAQSYVNWELLLIDDGSADSSGEIARQYAGRYADKMRYLRHPGGANLGMSASRNLGISSARGELVAFLDADDVWLAEKLDRQVEIMELQPAAAMVCGTTQYWYSWSGRQEDMNRDFVPQLGIPLDRLVNPPALFSALMQNQVVTSTGSLVRREVIETVGGYEESFRGLYEDQAFYAKVCLKAPVFISGGCWYKYRKHPDSCCAVAESVGRQYSERLLLLNWLESYLNDNAIKDKGVWQSLKRAQWKCRFPKLSRMPNHIRYRTRMTKETVRSMTRRIFPAHLYGWIKDRRRGRDYLRQKEELDFTDPDYEVTIAVRAVKEAE